MVQESDEVLVSGLENPAIGPLDWPALAPAQRNWLSPKSFRRDLSFLILRPCGASSFDDAEWVVRRSSQFFQLLSSLL